MDTIDKIYGTNVVVRLPVPKNTVAYASSLSLCVRSCLTLSQLLWRARERRHRSDVRVQGLGAHRHLEHQEVPRRVGAGHQGEGHARPGRRQRAQGVWPHLHAIRDPHAHVLERANPVPEGERGLWRHSLPLGALHHPVGIIRVPLVIEPIGLNQLNKISLSLCAPSAFSVVHTGGYRPPFLLCAEACAAAGSKFFACSA